MSLRRKVLIAFILLAGTLSFVGVAIWLNSGKGTAANGTNQSLPGTPPKVTFAEGASSGNAELDTFVRDFVELCLKGDYERFRLCWTAYSPQISSSRFRAMWDMADHIVITQIAPVPGKAKGKAYIVKASVTLHAPSREQHRDVDVLVIREDGKWVIAPAPNRPAEEKDLPSVSVAASAPATDPAKVLPEPLSR